MVEASGVSPFLRESATACNMGAAASEFETIFLEHYPRVLGVLVRVVGNRSRAEELANEVFWKLSRRPVSWLLANNVGAWLYRTAVHAGIDGLRASTHRRHYETSAALHTDNGASEAGALDELLREEQRVAVRRVLASMKPAQAQLLLMRADGLSYQELAETLQLAVGGIGTLLNRAEAEFRKRYLKMTGERKEI